MAVAPDQEGVSGSLSQASAIVTPMNDTRTETDFACSRWEPCAGFVPEVADSQVCDCGWLHDDHGEDAVVHRLPRAPRAAQPRRLAS
jgi:hypothetical protein